MKKVGLSVAIILSLWLAMPVNAQRENQSQREEMVARQTERLVKELNLSGSAKDEFVGVYKRYQSELVGVTLQDRQRQQVSSEIKEKDLTDIDAEKRIQSQFERQEQQIEASKKRLEIQRKYYEEFSKTLSPKQLMKIFAPLRTNRNTGSGNGQRENFNRERDNRGNFGGGSNNQMNADF